MVASKDDSLFLVGRHPTWKQQKSKFKQCFSPLSPAWNTYHVPSPGGEDREGGGSLDGRDFPFFISPAEAEAEAQQYQQQHPCADDSCAVRRGRTLPSLKLYSGGGGGRDGGGRLRVSHGDRGVTRGPVGEGGVGAQWEQSRYPGYIGGPGGGGQMGAYGQGCGAW
ncbi:hypothetical protein T484DRAFT_1880895 [Baffinella frigidus]|nr:hypothetical protein T484DRAFT_1880895 [Cryptophyta sp. CCMP2293]